MSARTKAPAEEPKPEADPAVPPELTSDQALSLYLSRVRRSGTSTRDTFVSPWMPRWHGELGEG